MYKEKFRRNYCRNACFPILPRIPHLIYIYIDCSSNQIYEKLKALQGASSSYDRMTTTTTTTPPNIIQNIVISITFDDKRHGDGDSWCKPPPPYSKCVKLIGPRHCRRYVYTRIVPIYVYMEKERRF